MIQLVDQCLERFVRRNDSFAAGDIDISFEAPDRDWGAGVTRPTVNLFLWDLRRNAAAATAGFEDVEVDGNRFRRLRPTAVELHYLTTAWASSLQDEHQLLGSMLQHVISNFYLPEEALPDQLRALVSGQVRIEMSDNSRTTSKDLWQALDGQLKPALQLRIMFQLNTLPLVEVGPPTEGVDVGIADRETPSRSSRRSRSVEELGTTAAANTP